MTTAIVRWQPETLVRRLERLVDDLVAPLVDHDWLGFEELFPADRDLELLDEGGAFVVRAALPGVREDDVRVELEGQKLTVRVDADVRRDGWSETYQARAELWLPAAVDADKAEAHLERGMLEVRLPKRGDGRRTVLRITPQGSVREEAKGGVWRLPFARRLLRRATP